MSVKPVVLQIRGLEFVSCPVILPVRLNGHDMIYPVVCTLHLIFEGSLSLTDTCMWVPHTTLVCNSVKYRHLFPSVCIIIVLRGSFIKFQDRGCNFSKNQVIPLKLCNYLYIYSSDWCLKFQSFIFYSFIFMQINVNA